MRNFYSIYIVLGAAFILLSGCHSTDTGSTGSVSAVSNGSNSTASTQSTKPSVSVNSINAGVAFDAKDEPPLVPDGSGGLVRKPLQGVTYQTTNTEVSVYSGLSTQ